MKKESIKLNVTFGIVFTLINGILSFIVNKYFSDFLGQENLGILRLFSQMIAYMNLAELGIAGASQSLLYGYFHKEDNVKIGSVISTIEFFYNRIAISILVIGLSLNLALPFLIQSLDTVVYLYWSLYVAGLSITYFYAKEIIILTSDQRYGLVQIIRNLSKISLVLLQILSLVIYQSFVIFIILFVIMNIIEMLVFKWLYNARYVDRFPKSLNKNKNVITKTKQLFIHNFAGVLVFNTDYIIITKFIDLVTVATYSSYLLVLRFCELLFSSIVNVIRPKIGNYYAANDKESSYNLFKMIYLCTSLIAVSAIYFLSNIIIEFVELWLGSDYTISKLTMYLILSNTYIFFIRKPLDIFKEVAGYFEDTHLPIIEGVLNLLLSIVLVNYLGLNGVILGTVISNILVIILMKPYGVYKNVFSIEYREYIYLFLKNMFLTSLSLFLLIEFNSYDDFTFVSLLILFFKCVLIPFLVFVVDKSFRDLIKVLLRTLINK